MLLRDRCYRNWNLGKISTSEEMRMAFQEGTNKWQQVWATRRSHEWLAHTLVYSSKHTYAVFLSVMLPSLQNIFPKSWHLFCGYKKTQMNYLVFGKSFEDTIMDPPVANGRSILRGQGSPTFGLAVQRRHLGQAPSLSQVAVIWVTFWALLCGVYCLGVTLVCDVVVLWNSKADPTQCEVCCIWLQGSQDSAG